MKSDGGTQTNAAARNATQAHRDLRDIAPAADPCFYLRRCAADAGVLEEAIETRGLRLQKFAELIRVHMRDLDALLGEGIADLRYGHSFGDFLVETRDATTAQIATSESEANEMLVDRERLEYDDEDGSSVASDIQRDQLKEYASALRLKVDEIDVALARIDDGSYGRCDECYEPISQPRLRAQLPVFTCVSCRASV